jgi:ABC-type sugar transport system ATPase subunit
MIAAGLVVLPADRLHLGGVATLPLADNVILPDVRRYWMRPGRQAAVLDRVIDVFDIRPPSPATLFGKLSGGNQQKTLLSKWLLLEPTVMVLDDPTNGIDPGAREKIFDRLRDAAVEGVGVLVFSTEPEQLANFCSRVLILREGRIVHELAGAALDHQAISHWCYA